MRVRDVNNAPRRRSVFGGIFVVLGAAFLTPLLPYAAHTAQADEGNVVINEIYPSPNTGENEWVELYNPTSKIVDLADWSIKEQAAAPTDITGELKPGSWRVFEVHDFNNNGDSVTLKNKDGDTIDSVDYPSINKGKSYARMPDGSTQWDKNVTSTKASWNVLDINAPEVTDIKVTNWDRWGNENLWEDDRFKSGNKLIVGGTIKLGATFTDDQRLEGASIEVKGEGEEKTFDGDEISQDGTNPKKLTATWNTGEREGNYTVQFTAKDGGKILGQLPNETTRSIELIVDNTAPSVSIASLQDHSNHEEYFAGSLTVKPALDDANGISRVWLGIRKLGSETPMEIMDKPWPEGSWSHEFDTVAFADGTYDLLVKAWDIAGNLSETYAHKITLNNFAPNVPIVGEIKSGAAVNGKDTVLDWTSGEDGNGGITYDFQWATTSDMSDQEQRSAIADSSTTLPVVQTDGTYYWRVKACDVFNTCSVWSDVWSIIIDTSGPKLTMDTPLRNGDGTYTIYGTSDEDTLIDIYLDGSEEAVTIEPVNGTWTYTTDVPLILGDHTFLVKSYDAVGNEGTDEVSFTVKVEPVIDVLSDIPRTLSTVSQAPPAVIAATSPVVPDVLDKAIKANADVLGSQAAEEKDLAPVEATPEGWMLLGVEWYWWALGFAGVGVGGWWMFIRRRAGTVV